MQQFSITYREQLLAISGEGNSYTVSSPGRKTIQIEHGVEGWYKADEMELYWTDHDISIGALIKQENPVGFSTIPFNQTILKSNQLSH